jgi:hypothetical protein
MGRGGLFGMCCWWRKVRRADIPKSSRDIFERFGEAVIGLVLAGGFTPSHRDLQKLYNDPGPMKDHAADWFDRTGRQEGTA